MERMWDENKGFKRGGSERGRGGGESGRGGGLTNH